MCNGIFWIPKCSFYSPLYVKTMYSISDNGIFCMWEYFSGLRGMNIRTYNMFIPRHLIRYYVCITYIFMYILVKHPNVCTYVRTYVRITVCVSCPLCKFLFYLVPFCCVCTYVRTQGRGCSLMVITNTFNCNKPCMRMVNIRWLAIILCMLAHGMRLLVQFLHHPLQPDL